MTLFLRFIIFRRFLAEHGRSSAAMEVVESSRGAYCTDESFGRRWRALGGRAVLSDRFMPHLSARRGRIPRQAGGVPRFTRADRARRRAGRLRIDVKLGCHVTGTWSRDVCQRLSPEPSTRQRGSPTRTDADRRGRFNKNHDRFDRSDRHLYKAAGLCCHNYLSSVNG